MELRMISHHKKCEIARVNRAKIRNADQSFHLERKKENVKKKEKRFLHYGLEQPCAETSNHLFSYELGTELVSK